MAPRPGLNRAVIARAAAALVDEVGVDGLTPTRLAEGLGVRPPSLYNHVTGIAQVRRDLAVLGVRELGSRLARAAVGRAGDEALIALAGAYRAFVREHPGLYAASTQAPAPGDEEWQAAGAEVVAIVLAALAAYRLAPDEAIHVVRGLRSLIHGFATLEEAGGFGLPLDLDESFARLLGAYLRGLHAGADDASEHQR